MGGTMKSFTRFTILGLLIILLTRSTFSNPFSYDFYDVYQPDGTLLHCEWFGDEFYSYLEDENGYVILLNTEDMYYYYAIHDAKGDLVVSTSRAGIDGPPASPHLRLEGDAFNELYEEIRAWEEQYSPPGGPGFPDELNEVEADVALAVFFYQFPDAYETLNPYGFNNHDGRGGTYYKVTEPDEIYERPYRALDVYLSFFGGGKSSEPGYWEVFEGEYETHPADLADEIPGETKYPVYGSLRDYFWQITYEQTNFYPADMSSTVYDRLDESIRFLAVSCG